MLSSVKSTDKLREMILEEIASGQLRKGERIMSLREISRRTGLSFVSVQKVTGRLCEEGYLFSKKGCGIFVSGKMPGRGRSLSLTADQRKNLYFVYNKEILSTPEEKMNDFYMSVLNGAVEVSAEHGFNLVYRPVDFVRDIDRGLMDELTSSPLNAGMLLVGETFSRIFAFYVKEKGIPHVLVDNYIDETFPAVLADCSAEFKHAVDSLAGTHGHRDFLFVVKNSSNFTVSKKLEGFRAGLEANGISFDPVSLCVYEKLQDIPELLAPVLRKRRITAVIAEHDNAALKVLEAAGTLGLSVPRDLSVVGCDDMGFASMMSPSLSSIFINKKLMGRKAVEFLVGGFEMDSMFLEVPCSYIERESVAAAPVHSW